jgi:tRNA A37 threonylcarbamoyladenosine modification protein TsaB
MLIAAGAGEIGDTVLAAIDARRGEVYYALYLVDRGRPTVLKGPDVAMPESAASHIRAWMEKEGRGLVGAGSGIDAYPDVWPGGVTRAGGEYPRAESLVRLCRFAFEQGETVDPMALVPLYLRRPDARERCGEGGEAGSC